MASRARTPPKPRPRPRTPPAMVSKALSMSNWRTRRHRPAPRAPRMANSRFRAVARTSRRFATFAQAMSSTRLTAPRRIIRESRTFPMMLSRSG